MEVEVTGITKSLDSVSAEPLQVLINLSFQIHSGELFAIVGPSGCGKTTLLKILAGLQKPDSGNINYIPPPEIIPIIWQEHRLFPWRTVLENIGFGLEVTGGNSREIEKISHEYVNMVGLKGFEDAYPNQLSEGMVQRVTIARALAVASEILLMDEPFASVDYQTKTILLSEIKAIQARTGITIVYVTHDIRDAIIYADRIMVLSKRPAALKEIIEVDPVGIPHLPLEEHIWKILGS